MKRFKTIIFKLAAASFCAVILSLPIAAQSRDQNFPSLVTTNEISGTIKARDIGDSRLTSFYYAFEGGQGDIFVNVVTKNFNGDIDVFNQSGLQPLTKMVIYADATINETGRLIYLRKPERLILRIQGRTPNDDSATFRIKFAGSFIALANQTSEAAPTLERSDPDDSQPLVNSVGTRTEVLPKPISAVRSRERSEPVALEPEQKRADAERGNIETEPEKKAVKKPVIIVGALPPATIFGKPARPKTTVRKSDPPIKSTSDPLASIRLLIQTKDGGVIEHSMSEVSKFNVDKGVLVIALKNGTTTRFTLLNIAKVTIE